MNTMEIIEEMYMNINIKYHTNIEPIIQSNIGDWIDLRAAETVTLKKGEFKKISLGISMQLPEGYEAYIVPRSSTPEVFGIIQPNSYSVIDNTYAGDNDVWKFPVLATRDTIINKNDRICQFRVCESQPKIRFNQVDRLDNPDRGGFGSSGVN